MISNDPAFMRSVDATHEAGHAIVATALGLKVSALELFSEPTSSPRGVCRIARTDQEDPTRVVISGVAHGLAGPLATLKRYGEALPYRDPSKEDPSTWTTDTDTEVWEQLSPHDQTRAFVICDYLLDLHWRNILALADEVFEKGIVTESSWLRWIPCWWDHPLLADRREIVIHLADGDVRRIVNTHPE
jgi:hypothetical protein